MKKVIIIVFVAITNITLIYSQQLFPLDSITGEVYYSGIEETSLNKENLYSNAKLWFATNLKEFNKTIELEDFYSGKLLVHFDKSTENFSHTFDIEIAVKDNKFRYKIYNIKYVAEIKGKVTVYYMKNYRDNYHSDTNEPAKNFALKLNNNYSEMGISIKKTMLNTTDF